MPSSPKVWFITGTSKGFGRSPQPAGDPTATGPAILELVDADEPPLRVFFGIGPLDTIRAEYERRIATWEQWDQLSRAAHGAR